MAERVRWRALALLPTPVEVLPSPPGFRGRLYVKRDDLTSSLYGGNKIRKFEYLFARAAHAGARTLVAVGGIGSNQGLAVALHGRALGFSVELSLAWQPITEGVRRNLRGMIAAGARLHYAPTTIGALWHLTRIARGLRRRGAAPFVLPIGATSAESSLGYVFAGFELAEQVRAGLLPEPDRIYVACGTCGTAAGLIVGCRLAGLKSRVSAVRISGRLLTNTPLLLREMRRVASFFKVHTGWQDAGLVGGYAGARYGAPTREAEAAIAWAAPRLSLETTYTGKALAACLDACRAADAGETILFWNTYNSASFAMAEGFDGLSAALVAELAEPPVLH
mgnify:FL=1